MTEEIKAGQCQAITRPTTETLHGREEPMRRTKLILGVLMLFVLSACAGADVKNTSSAPGQIAADFTLSDQDGKFWKLRDKLKDYHFTMHTFYPKDDTGA